MTTGRKDVAEWMREGLDVKTVVFLLVQIASLAWYSSSVNSRLGVLELQNAQMVPRSEYGIRDKALSDALTEMKASQLRIEEKLDAINERK